MPVINPGQGSDSAIFDNTLEFLVLAGRPLAHAMMMMIPEPWSNHESMDRRRAEGLLSVSLLFDGALGWPGLHRFHGWETDGRRAGPQRAAAFALLCDEATAW